MDKRLMSVAEEFEFTILCYGCMDEIPDEDVGGWYEAKFGFVPGDKHNILACPLFALRPLYSRAERFLCDGCGKGVAVAPSSAWFIEKHKQERTK